MDRPMSEETIRRLLGPADRELLCDECFEKLDEYVELELQGAEADDRIPGMRAHLEGCPACREDYDSLADLLRRESHG
jgi:predicted anti-sigma-YlaC factor YlaD